MKRFKTKKQRRYSNVVLLIVFVIFIVFFLYLSSLRLEKSYEPFINYIYNSLGISKDKNRNLLNYLMGNLDYLITDYMFYEEEVFVKKENSKPLVYIYNTHNQEEYKENNNYNIKATVITASYMLKDSLLKYNIESVVEERRVSDELKDKNYSDSYKISRNFLENAVLKNNQYEYFIDIHRDSVSKKYTEVVINDKKYARIMFVLGLENENFKYNKEIIMKINDYLNTNYKGISRGIYEKSGKGVNGIYNQDFHKNVMLIEIGGVDNDLESIFNSTQIIAEALYYIIGDYNEEIY